MSDLIVFGDTCGSCGLELPATDNFCSRCGSPAALTGLPGEPADVTCAPQQLSAPVQQIVIVPQAQPSVIDEALNNRAIVIGILLVAGPIGLPALWFSRRFSKRAKIIATVAYFLLTAVLPLAALWYFMEVSLRPLLDVFSG